MYRGKKQFDKLFQKKNGERFWVEITSTPVRSNNELKYCLSSWVDITERKEAREKVRQLETLKEVDRLRSDLLANVSHELRTPLTTIKGYATMLLEYDQRLSHDEKRQRLESIDRATDRLAELVDNLLDMSRLEAGLLKLEKKPIRISKLMREVVAEARVRSSTHRIVLKLGKRLPKVNIDSRRIRQVLDNLIDNATKYSRRGTEVVISAQLVRRKLLVSVADQGVGIPAEELPKVFNRMYRVQHRLAPEAGGAGLGLAICKGLLEAHGSHIRIESVDGKGTRCWFTLPPATKKGGSHGEEV